MESFFEELGVSEEIALKSKTVNTPTCEDCGLYKDCVNPKMKPSGKGRRKILIVAESPGSKEDRRGKHLIGEPGLLLREIIEELKFDLDLDFVKTNALICKSYKKPDNKRILACRHYLLDTFEKENPYGVILLGDTAYTSFLGYRMSGRLKKAQFSDFIGHCIPDQDLKSWIGVTWHPSYLLKNEYDIVLRKKFKDHLNKFINNMIDYPKKEKTPKIQIIKNVKEATLLLKDFRLKNKIIAYDYETTGIKPQREEQQIKTASISNGKKTLSFPFFDDDDFLNEWKLFLTDKNILKLSHKKSYETIWTKQKLGYFPAKPHFCTQLLYHCIDSSGKTSLKFLTYVLLGILGYDEKVSIFLESIKKGEDKKSTNSINRIEEANIDDVLYYNGLDSYYDFKVWEILGKLLKGKFLDGLQFLFDGDQVLSEIHLNGMVIDNESIKNKEEKITKKLINIEKRIFESEELKKWDGKKPFKIKSSPNLSHLLFNILKLKPVKETDKGNASVDKESLSSYDLPIVKNILQYRRWIKTRDTYIAQYKREQINGLIHPFFNLDGVVTFRSSSNSPNFQNITKRDKLMKSLIRDFFKPRKGNRIIEWDYGQMEVTIMACVSKDENLIMYCSDDSKDMHRDMAKYLLFKEPHEVDGVERFITKNKFVFREFYGGYYEQAAPEIWTELPDYTLKHLRKNGIKRLDDFVDHVKWVEEKLWEMFPGFKEWKQKTISKYNKNGYLDLKTGFRCNGPLTKNKIINYGIQGPAFHVLLWTLTKVHNELKIRKIKRSLFVGQIHDAAIGDVHEEDEELLDNLILDYGLNKVRDHWPWIIVPLKIEKERSEINGSWAKMENCGRLFLNN